MVSWVVNSRLHRRLATLFRHVTKYRSPQVLVDSALTNGDARNSFRIRCYENCRVSLRLLNIQSFKPSSLPTFFDLSLLFSHTSALFFRLLRTTAPASLFFLRLTHSLPSQRGGLPRHSFSGEQNEPSKD